jgi:hypothetical protein
MCSSHSKLISSNELMKSHLHGNEVLIFHDNNLKQHIQIEICDHPGGNCNGTSHLGIRTKCRQKYLSLVLNVLRPGTNYSSPKNIRIPSYCECVFLNKN